MRKILLAVVVLACALVCGINVGGGKHEPFPIIHEESSSVSVASDKVVVGSDEVAIATEPELVHTETATDDKQTVLTEIEVADETRVVESARTECDELVYTNTNSNIRVQPTTKSDRVTTVRKGTELKRTAVLDNGWSEISYDGAVCYISSKLVTTEKPAVQSAPEATPVTPAPVQTNNASGQLATGTTVVKDDITFVCWGQTPNGLNVYHCDWDTVAWPDYLVNAYDNCGITNDMSDYDKCVAINNYICSVVSYANYGATTEALTSACITTGEATCNGYAQAFDLLCTVAGINSRVAIGNAAGAHAWNRVLINGTEYWVDVTWNDSSNNAYLMSTSLWGDHEFSYIEQ